MRDQPAKKDKRDPDTAIVAALHGKADMNRGPYRYFRSFILLIMAATIAWHGRIYAGETRKVIRKDPFIEGQYGVYEKGRRTGTIRRDPFLKDQYQYRDNLGKETGTIRKDPFISDQWNITRDGKSSGSLRQNPFREDRYELRDRSGRKQGELRQSPFNKDEWQFEGRD